jgi:cell wall-associated NlpC family hydrolase
MQRLAARPALARRGLTGPAPQPGRRARPPVVVDLSGPSAALRLTALCVATTTVSAGLAVTAAAASAEPISRDVAARAVDLAAREAGDPYVWGAEGPDAFDCSGLSQYVFTQLGVSLPRTSREQHAATVPVPQRDARPGDLVFFRGDGTRIDHLGIYAGGGRMWAAPQSGGSVRLQAVYGRSWSVGRPQVSAGSAAGSSVLKLGSRGSEVIAVQRALGIPADGEYGPGTAAAVTRFQAEQRLPADGAVGRQTRQALLSKARPAPRPEQPAARPTVRLRDRGPAVAALQRSLRLPADGVFGPKTQAAVIALQRRSGLVADGVVGARTWAAVSRA